MHYKILSSLGKGGTGEVYLAQDTKLDRKVALKILPAEFAEDEDRMSRFVREAKSASALNHPNILTIYEMGEADGTHFIATEFIDGKTLNDYAKANSLDYKEILEIVIQIASALDEAHQAGIVHRDIKPDNIIVRSNGLAKILDFGIAKLADANPVNVSSEDATAIKSPSTSPGMIIGTANYMSPEQAKGQAVDARSDIFSFGVVLYEMISGHLPFTGETPMEIIAAVINKEPLPLNSDVPPKIAKIITKSLTKDRNERYQTIRDLLIDLKDARQALEFQDKLEKTVSPAGDEQKTQMLKAVATFDEQQQTITNENLNDSITIRKSSFNKFAGGALAILLVSAIGLGYWFYSKSSAKQIESIAVMPFAGESGNADVEYLSDGMTETLIKSLSNLPNLNVKPRSSVFRYKGKDTDLRTIARELNVQAILYLSQGNAALALDQAKKTVELDPNFSFGWIDLAYSQLKNGQVAEARTSAEKVVEITKRSSRSLVCLGFVYAASERLEESKAILKELEQRYENRQADATDVAALIEIVSSLTRQLTWTHFSEILPIKDQLKRDFYAEMCRIERWNVRTLRSKIQGMLFERTAISRKPEETIKNEIAELRDEDKLTPDLIFRDTYFLDFLGLSDTFSEKDLENAILRELEKFLLELGVGFAFVARQKRITVDGDDFHIDLLLYHRELRRLVVIELKLGKFMPADFGQTEFYLRWLDKYERKPWEESPIGLILCSEKSNERVELLALDKHEIKVADYWTQLPDKKLLEQKLHEAVIMARGLSERK